MQQAFLSARWKSEEQCFLTESFLVFFLQLANCVLYKPTSHTNTQNLCVTLPFTQCPVTIQCQGRRQLLRSRGGEAQPLQGRRTVRASSMSVVKLFNNSCARSAWEKFGPSQLFNSQVALSLHFSFKLRVTITSLPYLARNLKFDKRSSIEVYLHIQLYGYTHMHIHARM